MKKQRFTVKALAALCTLVIGGSVQAQTAAKVEEVIVTGQKIDRSLQDTAASVAVITEQAMSDQQAENFYDASVQSKTILMASTIT